MLDIGNVVAAFSEEQIEHLTGLSKGRLRYWDRSNFFKPSFVEDGGRFPYSRFYSFKNVVALRTLEMLRVQNGVPLQHLRKVAEKLSHLKDELWTKTTLFVTNGKVVMVNPETGKPEEVLSGQYLLGIPLEQVISDTRSDAEQMRARTSEQLGEITRTRSIAHNSWVVAGTRIPIGAIRRYHEDGFTAAQIIAEYPDLTPEDIKAALSHEAVRAA